MEIIKRNIIIKFIKGDITEQDTDAIVNAANSSLILGGGVAGAIRIKGGPSIQEECSKIGGTPVGTAVITKAGNLKAKYVIHAVGPRMGEGNEDTKLKNATIDSLKRADENGLSSITFPAISTGIFGYPMARCAKVMYEAVVSYINNKTNLELVQFCLYDKTSLQIFTQNL